jgi:hypothetical protein
MKLQKQKMNHTFVKQGCRKTDIKIFFCKIFVLEIKKLLLPKF